MHPISLSPPRFGRIAEPAEFKRIKSFSGEDAPKINPDLTEIYESSWIPGWNFIKQVRNAIDSVTFFQKYIFWLLGTDQEEIPQRGAAVLARYNTTRQAKSASKIPVNTLEDSYQKTFGIHMAIHRAQVSPKEVLTLFIPQDSTVPKQTTPMV